MADKPDPLLTPEDVAEILRVSPTFVRGLAQGRLIAHSRVGKRYRFTYEDVQEYVAATHLQRLPATVDPWGRVTRQRRRRNIA
jgi:excisionase family DNA binding protein